MAPADPWSGEDDDTGRDYCDKPSGNLWRPGAEPGQPSGGQPGRPDTGPHEVIRLGGQAAVVVPVTCFPRPRALALHAFAGQLTDAEDAAAPGRGASLPFPDRPQVASPPRARTRTP